jgi:peptidoglycan hydrolase CwlO-like protein
MTGDMVTAVIAATVTPVIAYLVAARQFSGKIETSNAADLWNESKSIRKWAMERVQYLENRVKGLEQRVQELELENGSLERENRRLERDLARCQTSQ